MFASTYFLAQALTFACGVLSVYWVGKDQKCSKVIGTQVLIAFVINCLAFLCSLILLVLTFLGCIKFQIDYIMFGRVKCLRRLTDSKVAWGLVYTMDLCMFAVFTTVMSFGPEVFQG